MLGDHNRGDEVEPQHDTGPVPTAARSMGNDLFLAGILRALALLTFVLGWAGTIYIAAGDISVGDSGGGAASRYRVTVLVQYGSFVTIAAGILIVASVYITSNQRRG